MSTQQNYVGRANSASPTEPTAQNSPPAAPTEAQPPFSPDERQTQWLHAKRDEAQSELAGTVYTLFHERGVESYVALILESAYARLCHDLDLAPDRDINPQNSYPLRDTHLDDLYGSLRLAINLGNLQRAYKRVEHFTNLSQGKDGTANINTFDEYGY